MRRAATFLLVTALASALLLEVGVRLLRPQILPRDAPELWNPDDVIGWRHRPGVRSWVNTGERDVEVCFDERGDRVDCAPNAARDCVGRVLVLGDSFVEALAIPWEQTAWALLEEDIGACLLVSGVSGYNLGQYLQVARERLVEPHDLVILAFYVGNDFTSDAERIPPAAEMQRKPFRLLPAGLTEKDLWNWFYPFNAWLESHSHAYVAGRYAIRRFQDPADVGIFGVPKALRRSRLGQESIEETVRGVRLIGEAAHRAGARLLLVVIPFRAQVLDPQGERLIAAMPVLRGDLDMDQHATRFLPRLEGVREVDAVVDLTPFLRQRVDREIWGWRDPHLTPKGHRLWFEALREPTRRLLD